MNRHCLLPEDVRAHNRGLLLRLVQEGGPLSRRELASRTGLSIPTVAAIIAELLDDGYLAESDAVRRSNLRGPKASQVALAPDSALMLGVDIGRTSVHLGLCDLFGVVVGDVVEVDVSNASAADVLCATVSAARPLVESAGSRLRGVGVGVPGPVDSAGRRCRVSLSLGWREVDVARPFEDAFGLTVAAEYNVRAMALAETYHGAAQQAENLLYVRVGDGMGFSFLVRGVPFRQGAHGVSELGHQQVAIDGPRCVCGGVGCLEAMVAEPYLRRRLLGASGDTTALTAALEGGLGSLDALERAVTAGEPAAKAILDDFVSHLSAAIALNVNVFSPTRVVLAGMLADAPDSIFERLVAETRSGTCLVLRDSVVLERSALGSRAGVLGAATAALDQLVYRARAAIVRPVSMRGPVRERAGVGR